MSQRADLAIGANSTTRAWFGRSTSSSYFDGATAVDLFAMVVAALLPVAISPVMASYTFTPKLAVLLVVVAVGFPLLAVQALRRAPAAIAASGFLVLSLASSLTSSSVLTSLFGMYLSGTGWLFWCATFSAWAIGRELSARGRSLVLAALLAGASADAVVAVLQQALQLHSPVLGLYQGTQADGLMGNPIFLESVLLGGLAILAWRVGRESVAWSGLAALLAASLDLSGERLAVPLLLLLALAPLAIHRNGRSLVFATSAVGGYGIAYALTRSLHTRLAASVTSSPRTALWHVLAHAFLHRPLLGFGPGMTMATSTKYQTLALAHRLAPNTYFTDAHDLFIEVGITTGILGFAAFTAFLGMACKAASGPLLGFACFALAVELVEPLDVGVTPLALLALGAACAGKAGGERRPRPIRAAQVVLVLVALATAATMLFGDYELNDGQLLVNYQAVARGADALPIWSQPATITASIAENRAAALSGSGHWRVLVRRWRSAAVAREPSNTELWSLLGTADVALGNLRLARHEYERSLSLDAYDVSALVAYAELERNLGQRAAARALVLRALVVAPDYPPARNALRALGG